MDDKNYIIDPLTLLCKLALMYFMQDGTKLRISHHILHIQEYCYIQGAIRMINGDTRKDISYLNMPILKAIKWYILENDERIAPQDNSILENIKIITSFSIKGLKKIQALTYGSDTSTKIILQYFINILNDAMDNNWNDDSIVKYNGEGSILTDTIKNNYDSHTLQSVAKMLQDADKQGIAHANTGVLVKCAHELLINRDNDFISLMKEINTIM
jgi:hypothetical protein